MLLTSLLLVAAAMGIPGGPYRLRVEYMDSPRGVDVLAPRFSWIPPCVPANTSAMATAAIAAGTTGDNCRMQRQSAYQIVVRRGRTADSPIIWDSGPVRSPAARNIKYGGPALAADTDYNWTLRCVVTMVTMVAMEADAAVTAATSTTETTTASSSFSTGLLTSAGWKGAAWIGASAAWPLSESQSTSQHRPFTNCYGDLAGSYRGSMK